MCYQLSICLGGCGWNVIAFFSPSFFFLFFSFSLLLNSIPSKLLSLPLFLSFSLSLHAYLK
ncbi:hypothetical protein DFH27DRAFT_545466 [Peziza echinospora]|nr:hypothetical protein DFH27DRAFT_545466 [Peziza echinospora]